MASTSATASSEPGGHRSCSYSYGCRPRSNATTADDFYGSRGRYSLGGTTAPLAGSLALTRGKLARRRPHVAVGVYKGPRGAPDINPNTTDSDEASSSSSQRSDRGLKAWEKSGMAVAPLVGLALLLDVSQADAASITSPDGLWMAGASSCMVLADFRPSLDFATDLLKLDPTNATDVLQYLLHHPVVTLVVSGTVYLVLPRLIQFATKLAVLLGLAVLLYSAVENHEDILEEILRLFSTVSSAALDHPMTTSAIILGLLALALSPYLLFGLAAVVIVGGIQLAPPQVKQFLPQPLRKAEDTVEAVQGSVRRPIKQLEERLYQTKASISAPITKVQDAVTEKTRSALRAVETVASTAKQTQRAVQTTAAGIGTTLDDITSCTKLPTPEERAKCVESK